jgi:hypothetical protein
MGQPLLRSVCLTVAILLVGGSSDCFGRGPGGPGGAPGGARSSGNKGSRDRNHAQPDTKKRKTQKPASAQNHGSNGLKSTGGLNATKKIDAKPGNFKADQFKTDQFNPQQLQTRNFADQQNWQPGQKNQLADGQVRRPNQNPARDLQHAGKPFTADWYTAHPNAWQQAHPHADAWAVTSAAGVAAWLGWASQPTYGTSNTVVYQQAPVEETETNYAYDNSTDTTSDGTTADDTDSAASDWLTIGVYSILAKSGENTSRLLQLACNRQGDLRGVEYDSISGESQNLTGRIDQPTQIATWQLDSNPQTTFRANLSSLTNSTGTVEVSQQGTTTQWRIARQENGS